MNTAAAPENAIVKRRKFLLSGGLWGVWKSVIYQRNNENRLYKLWVKLSEPQSSTMIENTASTGIESRLL
jgi:hypothetical protein